MRGVCEKTTPQGVRWALVPCTPSSASKAAACQDFGALAAVERDDRTTVSERAPHCFPGSRGNKTARGVQARGTGFHTACTVARRCRRATGSVARVTANRRGPRHSLPQFARTGAIVHKAMAGLVTRDRTRMGANLGRNPVRCLAHNGSTFSRVGASAKHGAVHAPNSSNFQL